MKLHAVSGLWSTGPVAAPPPLLAVLEVSGAVLSWTVDDPAGASAIQITFTDAARADWLWRMVGEPGHIALVSALTGRDAHDGATLDLDGVDSSAAAVVPLRRLALGHWLRRWWPASERDAIAALDPAVLDGEVALLTAGAEDYFTDDTLDSEVAALLAPHGAALTSLLAAPDERVARLARACAQMAADTGVPGWPDGPATTGDPIRRRDDFALAAGPDPSRDPVVAVATGAASIRWAAVAPGVFDAAEDTVAWEVLPAGGHAVARVRVAVTGAPSAAGVAVRLRCGAVAGTGALDAAGRATVGLVDGSGEPLTESGAWNQNWAGTDLAVGADAAPAETPQMRERVRMFARTRLRRPARDAFLAELLAAESDY